MKKSFGKLPDGSFASLYTLQAGELRAYVTDLGATLVGLELPDKNGNRDDVVLGFSSAEGYLTQDGYLGATVGRNANRIQGAAFSLNGMEYTLKKNENGNNLHSGPEGYNRRLWQTVCVKENCVVFSLLSPAGDQGFPGNAEITVRYQLTADGRLTIHYEAQSDRDTVFNLTNHTYFNLAGHKNTQLAMHQTLSMPARYFCPADQESIPTGELRSVEGTPMDFRTPKEIGRDIDGEYDALQLQGGYDHNWEVFTNPCAILHDDTTGRTMSVITDRPGIQFYAGNFLDCSGKDGVHYGKRSGVALETQFYPDAIHHPDWAQPVTRAGEKYVSETCYRFNW